MSAVRCPRCGQPLPEGANFCPNCGAPVSFSEASERRVVTVVFVDLASSTELAGRLDPERFREVIAGLHGMVSDEIARPRRRQIVFEGFSSRQSLMPGSESDKLAQRYACLQF